MATKSKPKSTAARKTKPAAAKAKTEPKAAAAGAGMFTMPDAARLAKYAKTLTPEQAFELYRANARLALSVGPWAGYSLPGGWFRVACRRLRPSCGTWAW